VALAGNRYYYQNPLIGDGLRRWEWHGCPCCPPMFLKMMGALPGFIYAQAEDAVYVNLFVGSRVTLTVGGTTVLIRQTTRYPWDGSVKLVIDPAQPVEFDLFVRIPGWSRGASLPDDLYQDLQSGPGSTETLKINGRSAGKLTMECGYARVHRRWTAGDVVGLRLDMPVRQVRAHPGISADDGYVLESQKHCSADRRAAPTRLVRGDLPVAGRLVPLAIHDG
jgi:DUF1680 family protein